MFSLSIAADVTAGSAPLTTHFTETHFGSEVTEWLWHFGDDTTSTSATPTKTYSAAGLYTVILTVTGPGISGGRTFTYLDFINVGASLPFWKDLVNVDRTG